MKKITLLFLLTISLITYGALPTQKRVVTTKEIKILSTFVEPLKITLSSKDLLGEGLRGVSGIKRLNPILIELSGKPNSKVRFSVEKEISLVGDRGDDLILTTNLKGGDVSYVGDEHESIVFLTTGKDHQVIELGGDIHLIGNEKSKEYLGILNIIVAYD